MVKASLEGFSAAADRPGVTVQLRGSTVVMALSSSLGQSDHEELQSEIFMGHDVLPGVEELVLQLGAPPAGAGAWLTSTWGAHPTIRRVRVVAGAVTVTATCVPKGTMTALDVEFAVKHVADAVDLFTSLPERDFVSVAIRVKGGKLSDDDRDALSAAVPSRDGTATFL